MLKVVGASWTQTRFSTFLIAGVALLGLFTIMFGDVQRDIYDGRYAATVFWNEKSGFRIEFWGQGNDPDTIRKGVARAYYRPDMLSTGWAVLEIETQPNYPDWVQTHAAGLLEGSLSWQLIYWHWKNTVENTCEGRTEFCDYVSEFYDNNTDVIREKARLLASEDSFWHQVNLFFSQLDGIEVGWRHAVKRSMQDVDIPHLDFLWLNLKSDLKDMELKFNSTQVLNRTRKPLTFALLKLLPNKTKEYVMTHATAGYYSSMLRVQKRYKFGLHTLAKPEAPLVPGQVIVFTSYPGSLHSQDDFYQINGIRSSFVVAGNRLKNFNKSLWPLVNFEGVPIGLRVLAACRLANSSKNWAEHVSINNSGTGNKQWVVVQNNNVTYNIWVVEQLPGITHGRDMTKDVKNAGYLISFGNPIFDDIRELGGYKGLDENEDFTVARLLLEQGQENITELHSMLEFLRSPEISLFGRGDLLAFDLNISSIGNYSNEHLNNNNKGAKNSPALGLYATNNHHRHYKGSFRDFFKKTIADKKIQDELDSIEDVDDDSNSAEDLKSEEIKQIVKVFEKNKLFLHNNKPSILSESVLPSEAKMKDLVGLIDFKISKGEGETFYASSGPFYSLSGRSLIIEPFQWSKSPVKYLPHIGQSDVWRFDAVEPNWVWKRSGLKGPTVKTGS